MQVTLIGIDCATDPKKVGLALGARNDARTVLLRVEPGISHAAIVETLARWVRGSARSLFAFDAPLGWPAALGAALARHRAGKVIDAKPDAMFRRLTDRTVKERLGKQPLDVGADRIARTAHAALRLIGEVSESIGAPIPLAWDRSRLPRVSAIEVYPAGTLRACGLPASGYKETEKASVRRTIVSGIARFMILRAERSLLLGNAHLLDAAVCVLAAGDFLAGNVLRPTDTALARKEGWIWVRTPDMPSTP